MDTHTFVLSDPGLHVFTVPEGVNAVDVKCIGPSGSQFAERISVQPSQQIEYYIQSMEDDSITYFGPYVSAFGNDKVDSSKIELTMYKI